jgi:hypothetical protein
MKMKRREMRVELTAGNWADIRDKIKGKDKFAVQKAVVFDTDSSGTSKVSAELMTIMTNTILTQVITAWSFPDVKIPSESDNPEEVLGDLDLDDYNLLEDSVKPLLNKVLQSPNRETPSG